MFLKFERDLYKQYDTSTSLTLPGYTINGIIGKSVYVRGTLVANLDSAFVGENINVNLNGLELVGEGKENYYLDLSSFKATVYPKFIEMFGLVKNRIDFSENTYVSMYSVIHVNEANVNLQKEGCKVVKAYNIEVKNGDNVIDIGEKVTVKVKVDNFDDEGLILYNYYNGQYEKMDYAYEDGYLIYSSNGLGIIVLCEEITDYTWMFVTFGIILFVLILVAVVYAICKLLKNRKKINKYKSLKRRKDYGNY